MLWPTHWRDFLERTQLVGIEIDIPEADDLSGLGGVIEILSEENAEYESDELYPGIAVQDAGFVCVGGCSIGTGDPYFINVNDQHPGPIYRIYHDDVIDENYDPDRAIVRVVTSYEDILRFIED